MDWFHCNLCFKKSGAKFAVSSCGHIFCSACIKSNQCGACGSSCSFQALSDDMKPQGKVFFQDPLKLFQSRLKHITQIATFQQTQMSLITAHFKRKSTDLEKQLKDVSDQSYRQISELKRENSELKREISELKLENADLKKPFSKRRVSTGQFVPNSSQRMSLPVAVTSPVTPHSRLLSCIGSAESHRWSGIRAPSLSLNTPQSTSSISSHSSRQDQRTPLSFSTPSRTETPNVFDLQFMSGLSMQSPRY